MADSCGFGKLLNTLYDKLLYARQTGRKNIKELDDDLQCILLWRARLLEEKDNVFTICSHHEQLFGKVFERKTDKCCNILKSHRRSSKTQRVINLEIAKILKEKGFNDVLSSQKLCWQCVTEYEKLTKPPENENMTEIIETESSQDELASDYFLLYESPKKKLNSTLESIGVSPVNIHGVAQHSRTSNAKGKLKKVLSVYKENISAAYNVSDIEIEELPPIYDKDTTYKAEELDRLHAAINEKLVTASNTENLQILTLVPDSWSRKYCSEYFGVSEYLI